MISQQAQNSSALKSPSTPKPPSEGERLKTTLGSPEFEANDKRDAAFHFLFNVGNKIDIDASETAVDRILHREFVMVIHDIRKVLAIDVVEAAIRQNLLIYKLHRHDDAREIHLRKICLARIQYILQYFKVDPANVNFIAEFIRVIGTLPTEYCYEFLVKIAGKRRDVLTPEFYAYWRDRCIRDAYKDHSTNTSPLIDLAYSIQRNLK